MVSARWVAKSLKKHTGVSKAEVVNGDCVTIARNSGYRDVTVRVVDRHVDPSELDRIGLDDVDAIVTIGKNGTYSWDAKMAARTSGHDLYTNRELWRALNASQFVGSESSDVLYCVERVGGHDKVGELERVGPRLFRVHRTRGLDTLLVYCAHEYILSEQFVHDVLAECPEVQVITNLSSWNKITAEAAEEAKRRGCRVLDLSGAYGALNLDARSIRDG